MPTKDSYHLHCHRLKSNHSNQNSETRLAAQNVPGGLGNTWMKSSSRIPREAPMEVVCGVWAVMASAAQVHSRLVAVEARNLTRSSVHRCIRAMSMGEGGRSRLPDMSSWRWCQIRSVSTIGGAGIRRFRPRGGHQNNPFRG